MITHTALFRYFHYHRPSDTPDKVDTEKVARVVKGIERVIRDCQLGRLENLARDGIEPRIAGPICYWLLLRRLKSELSSQEFFFQRIAVGGDGLIKCVKLRFFDFADQKSLVNCHIAVDHRW